MNFTSRIKPGNVVILTTWILWIPLAWPSRLDAQWPQWGGPNRDFKIETSALATSWPESGPRRLWGRPLGAGESAITVDDNRLYTMFREGKQEVIIALDPSSGETLWEYKYDAPLFDGIYAKHSAGPHSTPTIAGRRLYAIGVSGLMHCLDKETGKRLWSHDFLKEYNATIQSCGFSASPLAYGDTVIVPVGGAKSAVMAFDRGDGRVTWKSDGSLVQPGNEFGAGYASPILINLGGRDQVVVFMPSEVAGLDPVDGTVKWRHPHRTEYGVNASTPIWGPDNILFITSAYDAGSRALKLTRKGDKTTVKELWFQKKMRVHFGSTVRVDDHIYGTTGDFGPAFLVALNAKTGKITWRKRDIVAKASCLYADRKLLALDEKGKLLLARVSPAGVEVLAQHQVTHDRTWTVPTLVGSKLYLRDRKNIMAFDLS